MLEVGVESGQENYQKMGSSLSDNINNWYIFIASEHSQYTKFPPIS